MKILVLSDNHYNSLKELDFTAYDAVIHCGDCGNSRNYLLANNALFVDGNCDYGSNKIIIKELFNKKIMVTHGDIFNVKYNYDRLIYKALENGVDVVFFGHTHAPTYFKEEGIIFLNPGAYPYSYIEIFDDCICFIINDKKKKIDYSW